MANKAIKYRIYPTTEQSIMFSKTFGCCRKVYNLMLSDKIEGYKATGKFPTVTPAKYKKDYPYLKEVDSLALANKQMDLQAAFRSTFSKSRKKKNGFPRFKSAKHSRKSYTTNNQKGTVAIMDKRYIKLPKVGKVKAVIHRIPDDNWIIKSATISQESDGKYYISVLFEFEKVENTYIADKMNAIGLDYASDGLYVDSNGNVGTNHKYYRESHDKLAKVQRKLSRMQGSKKYEVKSNNYIKQLRKYVENRDSSFETNIKKALLDCEKIMTPFLKKRYIGSYPEMVHNLSARTGDFRNGIAHSRLDLHFEAIHLSDIKIVEELLYAIRLKKLGLQTSEIQKAISDLFLERLAL